MGASPVALRIQFPKIFGEFLSRTVGEEDAPLSLCPAPSDLCPFPLSGQLCETPPHLPAPRSPCEGTECQNGANCVDQGSRPVCQCLPGFSGPECEKLLSVNFVDRDTYLQFTDLQNWPRANITLQVRAQGAWSQRGVRQQGTLASGPSIWTHPCPRELGGPCVSQSSLDVASRSQLGLV